MSSLTKLVVFGEEKRQGSANNRGTAPGRSNVNQQSGTNYNRAGSSQLASSSRPPSRRNLAPSQLRLHRIVLRNRDNLNQTLAERQAVAKSAGKSKSPPQRTPSSQFIKKPFKHTSINCVRSPSLSQQSSSRSESSTVNDFKKVNIFPV